VFGVLALPGPAKEAYCVPPNTVVRIKEKGINDKGRGKEDMKEKVEKGRIRGRR